MYATIRQSINSPLEEKIDRESQFKSELMPGSPNRYKHQFAEELVRNTLEYHRFHIFSHGYEYSCRGIQDLIEDWSTPNPDLDKLRTSPDFFALKKSPNLNKEVAFYVEVKYRTVAGDTFQLDHVDIYKKYWPETVLFVVLNKCPYMIAQRFRDLETKERYAVSDFRRPDTFFYGLTQEEIAKSLARYEQKHKDKETRDLLANFDRSIDGAFRKTRPRMITIPIVNN